MEKREKQNGPSERECLWWENGATRRVADVYRCSQVLRRERPLRGPWQALGAVGRGACVISRLTLSFNVEAMNGLALAASGQYAGYLSRYL